MARHVFTPFATPGEERIFAEDWGLVPHAPSVGVEVDRLEGWDHTVDLDVSVTIRIDSATLAEACDLADGSRFDAVLGWHATGSGLRGTAAQAELADGGVTRLRGELEGSKLGGRLRLTAAVVLQNALQPGPVAPTTPGSILFRVDRSWLLEGVGDRFPVERFDFRAAGMRHPNAAWVVQWDRRDPEWDAHAAVRLQLNSRHPLIEEMADPGKPEAVRLHSVMRRDVLRELVTTAIDLDGFVIDFGAWPEGSLGQALSVLLASLFPDASIEEVHALRRDDPAGFEAVLQGGSGFLLTGASL